MLIEAYIYALLVNEELADLVWEAWDAGKIADGIAAILWACLVCRQRLSVFKQTEQT